MTVIIDIPDEVYNFIIQKGHLPYGINIAGSIIVGKVVPKERSKWLWSKEWSDWECPHCGHAFENRMNFCGYCGADFRGEE